jgi:hypothetical protein
MNLAGGLQQFLADSSTLFGVNAQVAQVAGRDNDRRVRKSDAAVRGNSVANLAIPDSLNRFAGRIIDIDTHEMAATLDMWHGNNQHFGKTQVDRLPLKPSEYIQRNVRVSAFDFEHVDEYIARYGLEDVYCYASDFPHIEGGKDPMGRFVKRLEGLGPEVMEKFFVKNGEYLIPE